MGLTQACQGQLKQAHCYLDWAPLCPLVEARPGGEAGMAAGPHQ